MRPPYCERCGFQLRRSFISYQWRCECISGMNIPQTYDERFVPYRVAEKTRQTMLPGICPICEETKQSKAHRLCIEEKQASKRAAAFGAVVK